MFKYSSFLIGLFLCVSSLNVYAQPGPALSGSEYLGMEDYNRALTEFLKNYKETPTDIKLNYNIGLCYVHTNIDKTLALPYLEFVYGKDPNYKEIQLLLGQANMFAYKFDEAITFFNSYREKTSSKNYKTVDRYIENCMSAKILVRSPLNVTFQNVGKEINSPFPDYYPFVTQDEGTLYFTTRREGSSRKTKSWQGYYTADIYFSKAKTGLWTKAKNIGPLINTPADEECVSVSPDGKNMVIYIDNEFYSGDIYLSTTAKNKLFQKPVPFDPPVNSDELELEGCLANNGKSLIIACDKKNGLGDIDLWMFKKLDNGTWGSPVNLGAGVNTKYKESYPYYDDKNKVLYFASEGHTSMGGFDIFRSKFDSISQTFGLAENIGYPINTPEDNIGFSLAKNGRDAYVSAVRKGGFGDLDIYKVTFNSDDVRLTVLQGIISTPDAGKKDIIATVTLNDLAADTLIDSQDVNPKTGNYVFGVGPGKYKLTVSGQGFEDYSVEIVVPEKVEYVFEIENNILLKSDGSSPPPKGNPKKPK